MYPSTKAYVRNVDGAQPAAAARLEPGLTGTPGEARHADRRRGPGSRPPPPRIER